MGSKWKELTIEELKAPVKSAIAMGPFGSRIKAENFVDSGVPILKGGNLHKAFITEDKFDYLTAEKAEELKTSQAIRKDLVITHRGTIGQVSIIPDNSKHEKYIVSQSQLKVTLNQDLVNPYYVNYFFRSRLGQHRLLANASQVGVPAIAKASTSVKKILVPCPTLNEQNRIVEVLSSLDNKIELNQQTNRTLEQLAQTLFKSWFVDFDPVFDNLLAKIDFDLTKLPNDFPEVLLKRAEKRLLALNTNESSETGTTTATDNKARLQTGKQAQSANIHQYFPSEFEFNEQLGWIPKGWKASTTDDEFVVKGGSTPSTKNPDFWEGGDIHWTSPKDLSGNPTKIMIDTSRKITEQGLTKITSGLLPIDTVLMSSRAPVGYLALAKIPVAINQGYIAITDAKTLSSEYTIQWLDSVMDEIKSISGGTTFAEISKKTFKSIQIVIPQKDAVDAYTQIAKANYQRITANVQEINTLMETRDYLLPKLISCEINLNGVEHE